jgi:hypothetical protein
MKSSAPAAWNNDMAANTEPNASHSGPKMKALLVADPHFNLSWFDWIDKEAEAVDGQSL